MPEKPNLLNEIKCYRDNPLDISGNKHHNIKYVPKSNNKSIFKKNERFVNLFL